MTDMAEIRPKRPFSSRIQMNQLKKQKDILPTQILGIKLAYEFGENNYVPFKSYLVSWGFPLRDCVGFVDKPTITSAKRLEAVILRLVAKTNYNNFKNPNKVELGRYWIKLDKFNLEILRALFNYVLNHQSSRVSKSWLPHIQQLILEKEIAISEQMFATKKKIKRISNRKGGAKLPFPKENYVAFDMDGVRSTKKTMSVEEVKAMYPEEDLPEPINIKERTVPSPPSWWGGDTVASASTTEPLTYQDYIEPPKSSSEDSISSTRYITQEDIDNFRKNGIQGNTKAEVDYYINTGSMFREQLYKAFLQATENMGQKMKEPKGGEPLNNDIASKKEEW